MELNIDKTEYLKRFKVRYPKSFFPDFGMLKEGRCPICFMKLHWQVDGKKARCKSKRRDKFFISKEAFNRFI